MKRICSLLSAALLCLVCLLPLRALAASDYDLAYDATDRMNEAYMNTLGTDTFYRLTDSLGAQVRLDIVTGLEGETIQDYARAYYDAYNYGVGADRSCILLMLCCHEDDTGLAYDDHYILTAGGAENILTADGLAALEGDLAQWFSPEAWSGDLAQDVSTCEKGLDAYTSYLTALSGGSAAAPLGADADEGIETTGEDGVMTISAQESLPGGRYVMDMAGILTEEERVGLEEMAGTASDSYASGVYVVTVNDYRDYNSESPYEAAKTIYNDYGLGYGDDHSGAMLMLSMNDRDYAYIAHGDFANYAFTDYGKDRLEDEFLDDFRDDDWYGGFYDFISESEAYMAKAAAGNPVDVEHIGTGTALAGSVGMGALVSCAGSAIKCNSLKKKMKSVKTKADATQYIAGPLPDAAGAAAGAAAGVAAGIIMRAATDQFINTTVTRVPIHVDNDDHKGGWGGGTTIDIGGFSGHSGKF